MFLEDEYENRYSKEFKSCPFKLSKEDIRWAVALRFKGTIYVYEIEKIVGEKRDRDMTVHSRRSASMVQAH